MVVSVRRRRESRPPPAVGGERSLPRDEMLDVVEEIDQLFACAAAGVLDVSPQLGAILRGVSDSIESQLAPQATRRSSRRRFRH